MGKTPDGDTTCIGGGVHFQTTRWNLVLTSEDPKSLDALIRAYWKPLYFFVRQHGHNNETAKDIVQSFLTGFLERGLFAHAAPERGRFRTYLLACLENFVKDWAKTAGAAKRGGGMPALPLDFDKGEREFQCSLMKHEDPARALNRAWARGLLQQSLSELEGEAVHLEAFRLYREHEDLLSISRRTGLSVAAAQSAIHRLKLRLRAIVTGHIRETVSSEEEFRAELAEFIDLLS